MDWLQIIGPAFGFAGIAASAWFGFRGKKREVGAQESVAQRTAIAERWDDASELAKYIREQIEQEVERQVAPIRAELDRVKNESHEMHDAVRARETQLWLWDQRGRPGDLPMLPAPILTRLGLGYLITHESSRKD